MNEQEILAQAESSAALFGPLKHEIFTLKGRDAERYLHGRVTQNIKAIPVGRGARSLVLNPQGRILGQFLLLRLAESYLIVSDPIADAAAFVSALMQFKVADDVQIESMTDRYDTFRLVGPNSDALLGAVLGLAPEPFSLRELPNGTGWAFRNKLGTLPSLDFILRKDGSTPFLLALKGEQGSATSLEALRIRAKEPRMGLDIGEDTLAPEIPLAELVSFEKGCYAGQEVVEMATARGRPNRELILLAAKSGAEIPADTALLSLQEGGKTCGTTTKSTALSSTGVPLALAFLKRQAADEQEFDVGGIRVRRI